MRKEGTSFREVDLGAPLVPQGSHPSGERGLATAYMQKFLTATRLVRPAWTRNGALPTNRPG